MKISFGVCLYMQVRVCVWITNSLTVTTADKHDLYDMIHDSKNAFKAISVVVKYNNHLVFRNLTNFIHCNTHCAIARRYTHQNASDLIKFGAQESYDIFSISKIAVRIIYLWLFDRTFSNWNWQFPFYFKTLLASYARYISLRKYKFWWHNYPECQLHLKWQTVTNAMNSIWMVNFMWGCGGQLINKSEVKFKRIDRLC